MTEKKLEEELAKLTPTETEQDGNAKGNVNSDELDPVKMLLRGPLPEIRKMKQQELRMEVEMWRNIWSWVHQDLKYYLARVGKQVRIVRRDYKGYLGVLLETNWKLEGFEVGTAEKLFDANSGKYFFERKIVKIGAGQVINVEWVEEREQLESDEPMPTEVEEPKEEPDLTIE